jgi:uncharacterized protein
MNLGMKVLVCYSPRAREVLEIAVQAAPAATVQAVIEQSGLLSSFPEIDLQRASVGVWARKVSLQHRLHDNDRVEIYRALTVDPKVARRERFQKQGARGTGLFAKRRPGSKPGY